jgi:PAS domain S-box-containing protein
MEQTLRDAQDRLGTLLSDLPTFLYVLRYVNGAFENAWIGSNIAHLVGYTSEEAVQPGWWTSGLHPDDREATLAAQEKIGCEGRLTHEYRFRHKDGSYRWIRDELRVVRDDAGAPREAVGAWFDITDLKRTEAALRDSEARYKALVRAASDAVWHITPDPGTRAERLAWWHDFTGQTAEQSDQWGWLDVVHPDDRARSRAAWEHALAERVPYELEFRIRHRSGDYRHIAARGVPVGGGPEPEWIGTFADITDRRRAEAALKASEERLRFLSRRLLDVQEQERRHLARELHDEIGQLLTGLKLQLDAAERGPIAEAVTRLAQARDAARDLTEQVRELSLRLRPSMLDDLGLVPAVRWLAERVAAQTRVTVEIHPAGCDRRFPPEVETAAYRIVQEALTNVARHAGTTTAEVTLSCPDDVLTLTVTDRGAGFDVSAVGPVTSGLSGMRERAALLCGGVTVTSAPGAGTTVTATLPLSSNPSRGG